MVCSNSCKSPAVESVCAHILNCCSGASIRVEMNGLRDLKMYSRYDCHYRVRADRPSDVCTLFVGVWLDSLYSSFIRKHEDKYQHWLPVGVQRLGHVGSQGHLGEMATRVWE